MATALAPAPRRQALNNPALLRRVNELRRPDNVTNWFYLAREYLFLAAVSGLAVSFFQYQAAHGLSRGWSVLVGAVAVVLIGAGQQRLSTLAREASHYMLFRNRLLNELASD